MRLLVESLELDLPGGRLKLRLNPGPFRSQGLGLRGEGSSIIRFECLAQRMEGAGGAGNGKPLRIRRSRICHEAEGGAIDERFKLRNPQPDFGSFLGQSGQPLIAGARSQDLRFVEEFHQFPVGGELPIGKQLPGSVQADSFLERLVIDEEERLVVPALRI